MFDLSTRDIKYLQGVGPQRAAILNKELNIYSFRDLLYYFPYKYVDRSRLYYIHEIDGNMPYIQLKVRYSALKQWVKVANGVWSGIFPTEQVLSIWYGFRD